MKTLSLLVVGLAAGSAHAFTFSDITWWVGSGTKQAAMVIDWHSGPNPQSIVYGYRFEGVKTGLDMLEAVKASDARLYTENVANVSYTAIFGMGFDRNQNGFSKSDAGDSYREGWFTNGFWGYYKETTAGSTLGGWEFASVGFTDRVLSDGSWDAWSWAQDFSPQDPRVPTPVPEPSTMIVMLAAGVGITRKFRRK